ncbi:Crp/Fnr family transcriptional regulator [Bacteriovorax sp. Seq25_V]|uniref:Crp/Fnr family transcriptional regulator n=1 Tax=Bacteriovorax sp. Seq25_V TaxID=1201288 RepID=UPI00038A3945|nr:cyclic nucleotide-binding domain-containing protein [Bacteriovorax sp. Seq25_V]EQC44923.1 cyclic nucleotide-binding domain protein [Bacteriovorax sp. Seq25_V]
MSIAKKRFKKNDIICRTGDDDQTLYFVEKGSLLVFVIDGTQVTPIAYIGTDEFVGELSYFDKNNRSAYVMALDEAELLSIPTTQQEDVMPDWTIKLARNLTKRIRHIDHLISKQGIKRKNVESIKPLSIEQQRNILKIISETKK